MSNEFFREKLYTSPVPLQPEQTDDAFREYFGYKFAQALNDFAWSKAATPSHMVKTYPVALQRAWEEIDSMDATWVWWNQAYETVPMVDMYAHLLHQTVDLACHQNQWSYSNKQALHAYVEEFMNEMRNPQFGICADIAKCVIMNYAERDISESEQDVVRLAATLMAQRIPNNISFNGAYCVDTWVSQPFEDIDVVLQEDQDGVAAKYSIESAVCTSIMNAADSYGACMNVNYDVPQDFAEWKNKMPEVVHDIMQMRNIQLDALSGFHETDISLSDFVGEAEGLYLQYYPELSERFAQEASCFWQSKYGMVYSDDFTPEEVARGFLTLTPLTESQFEAVDGLTSAMSLTERQFFLREFESQLANNPLDVSGAIINAFGKWRSRFEPTFEISNEFVQALNCAMDLDHRASMEFKKIVPVNTIAQEALGRMDTLMEAAGVTADARSAFQQGVLQTPQKNGRDWSFTSLYLLAEDCAPQVDDSPEWQQYWSDTADTSGDAYKVWMQVINETLQEHTSYGGYTFQNQVAQHCAMAGKDTFAALPLALRYQLAQNIETAIQHSESLSSAFKEACLTLPADIQAQIDNIIAHDGDILEQDDIDIADIQS